MFGWASESDLEKVRLDCELLKSTLQESITRMQAETNSSIGALKEEIARKATDSEQEAREAAASATRYCDEIRSVASQVQESVGVIFTVKDNIVKEFESVRGMHSDLSEKNSQLEQEIEAVQVAYDDVASAKEDTEAIKQQVDVIYKEISDSLAASKELSVEVGRANESAEKCDKMVGHISGLLDHSLKKKAEIDELHRKIYGQDVERDDGQLEHINGLKDELDGAYKKLADGIKSLSADLGKSKFDLIADFDDELKAQQDKFENIVNDAEVKVNSVHEQLMALLPGGMAAGLSAAYESKKIEETTYLSNYESTFSKSIMGMVGVSLIPFFVDVYLLGWKGYDILSVIRDTPSLIVSIMPLYFPVLWIAYSSSKKINLSKRLIEEYAHKAALGKTFSGLSNQINDLPHENAIKEDLRLKLLFNVLQMSSENPGKLITDYGKADHPVMEALERSAKLSESMEAIAKIPGFGVLIRKLSERNGLLFNEQLNKVMSGFEINSAFEEKNDQKINADSGRGDA